MKTVAIAIILICACTVCFAIGSGTNEAAAVCAVLFVPLILALYFLPSIAATTRHRPGLAPLFIVNLFLGWTLIGWVGCLAWAVSLQPVSRSAQ